MKSAHGTLVVAKVFGSLILECTPFMDQDIEGVKTPEFVAAAGRTFNEAKKDFWQQWKEKNPGYWLNITKTIVQR